MYVPAIWPKLFDLDFWAHILILFYKIVTIRHLFLLSKVYILNFVFYGVV